MSCRPDDYQLMPEWGQPYSPRLPFLRRPLTILWRRVTIEMEVEYQSAIKGLCSRCFWLSPGSSAQRSGLEPPRSRQEAHCAIAELNRAFDITWPFSQPHS